MDLTVHNREYFNELQRQHELRLEANNFAFSQAMNDDKESNGKQTETNSKSQNEITVSEYQLQQPKLKEVMVQGFHGLQYTDLSPHTTVPSPVSKEPDNKLPAKITQPSTVASILPKSTTDLIAEFQPELLARSMHHAKQEEIHTDMKLEQLQPNPRGGVTPENRNQVLDEFGNPVRRPMNAFMIWSKEQRQKMAKDFPKMHNAEISKHLGLQWRSMTDEEKKPFLDNAKFLRTEHMRKYPNYRYTPRRKPKVHQVQQKTTQPSVSPPQINMDTRQQYPYHFYRPMLYTAGYPTTAAVAASQTAVQNYSRMPHLYPQYYSGFGTPMSTAQQQQAYMQYQAAYNPYPLHLHSNVQPPRRCASVSSSYAGSEYSYPSMTPSPTFSQSPPGTVTQSRSNSPISNDEGHTGNLPENDLGEMINIYLPENDV